MFTSRLNKILLPAVIRKHTISDMTFKCQPTFCSRNKRIFRNTDTDLRNRTRISRKCQAATTQQRIIELTMSFLASDTQSQATVFQIRI